MLRPANVFKEYDFNVILLNYCAKSENVFFSAREKIVGWYHTGPKLKPNDVIVNELVRKYCPNSVSGQ